MTYTPVIPLTGYAGWKFLARTEATQRQTFASSSKATDEAYFREKIATVTSAEELVGDYRLLRVVADAFGLSEDTGKKYLLTRVLAEGSSDDDALANKLSDKRYLALSRAFGFGEGEVLKVRAAGFADRILVAARENAFQDAVGAQNTSLGLALKVRDELPALASAETSDRTKWYSILGSTSMRTVFEGTFGLPDSISAIDIDRQAEIFEDKSKIYLGVSGAADLADPDTVEKLIRLYLLRADSGASTATRSSALTLLQGGGDASSLLSILAKRV